MTVITRRVQIREVKVGNTLDLGNPIEQFTVREISLETSHITIIDFTDYSTRAFDPNDEVLIYETVDNDHHNRPVVCSDMHGANCSGCVLPQVLQTGPGPG